MNRLMITGVVALAAALGGLYWIVSQQPAPGLNLPSGAANAQEVTADLSLAPDMSIGNPDAPVTVIEYASYTCPHCASFHQGAFKDLKSEFIDTGKINFVYREVYFDKFGLWAGLLARCGADTNSYFAITELLYENQRAWSRADSERGIAANLRQLGKSVGFSDAQLDTCMQDNDKAQAMVAAYQKNATEDGIRSTPSFVINGKLHSNMSWDEFKGVLADAGAN